MNFRGPCTLAGAFCGCRTGVFQNDVDSKTAGYNRGQYSNLKPTNCSNCYAGYLL